MTDKEKIIEYIDKLLEKYPKNYYLLTVAEFIDSLQKEPVSEELEEAAWLYYDKNRLPIPSEWNLHKEFIDFFKAGAQWGKNQTKVEIQAQSMALAHGCPKEPVSEDLPHIRYRDTLDEFAYQCAYDLSNDWAKETPEWKDVKTACKLGANWQKEQFEKNRLTHCDAQTEEEAEIESDFVMSIIENEHRQPTFDDAIKYGMRLQRENMMKDAVDAVVHIEAGNYPYIPQLELYDYDKDIPLAKEGDKYKVILIKE